MAGLCEALSLLFACHGRCLRMIASNHETHYNGLSVAARAALKRGQISQPMRKKLEQVDAAYNLSRHITLSSVTKLEADLLALLGEPVAVSFNDHAGVNSDVAADPVSTGSVWSEVSGNIVQAGDRNGSLDAASELGGSMGDNDTIDDGVEGAAEAWSHCPDGHALFPLVPDEEHQCGRCLRYPIPFETIYRCDPCNYVLCAGCVLPPTGNITDLDATTAFEPAACRCGVPSLLLTITLDGPNLGRRFFTCSGRACDHFRWIDEV